MLSAFFVFKIPLPNQISSLGLVNIIKVLNKLTKIASFSIQVLKSYSLTLFKRLGLWLEKVRIRLTHGTGAELGNYMWDFS